MPADQTPRPAWVPPLLVVAAGLLVWWGVWRGEFLFDDNPAIVDNLWLQAHDWWNAAFGAPHQPLANRPLACLTLVVDRLVFGPGPFGPHLTNLLLHLANAVLLLVTVRRVLALPNLAGRFDPAHANAWATAVATVWVVHPLAADAVAYATQRSTLLASACLLLALYASARRWRVLVLVALVLGMASKEEFVAAPILLVLFDRAFVLPSWSPLRARIGWHLALASTWLVLIGCVALGPDNSTVGFATEAKIGPHEWLMTQAGVVAQYLRLSLWPSPLRGAYDWGYVRDFGSAVLPGLLVVGVLVAVILGSRRWPWWGWLGALFFLLLAPTSTILPIDTEVVAERRVYLPMLFPIVTALIGGRRLLQAMGGPRWLAAACVAIACVALGVVTRQRVAVYAHGYVFWDDAYGKRDPGSRSFLAAQLLGSRAAMLYQQGRFGEGNVCIDEAMQCERQSALIRTYHAMSLQQRGDSAAAITKLRELTRTHPGEAAVFGELGTCLMRSYEPSWPRDDPRLIEAEAALQRAVQSKPDRASYWNSLGNAHYAQGEFAEAVVAYQRSTELTADHPEVFLQLAATLQRLGRTAEIAPLFDRLLAARPRDVGLRLRLVDGAIQGQDFVRARALLQQVLALEPQNAQAAELLRRCPPP